MYIFRLSLHHAWLAEDTRCPGHGGCAVYVQHALAKGSDTSFLRHQSQRRLELVEDADTTATGGTAGLRRVEPFLK